ncbi:DUF547 domain-containing protein [Algivirga pacifica]|uniref:DUF547 domain-containing protein n=1 Tax=Algivirga pacifica TaxID=1162670 RepID=A0ABP9D7I1_9BACT
MNIQKFIPLLSIIFTFFFSTCSGAVGSYPTSTPVDHSSWSRLLQKHVQENGRINYEGFKEDEQAFQEYLDLLRENHPNPETWNEAEQLAYWLNAYNAFTIELILKNYPLKSIKDINTVNIPFVHSPWTIKFIEIQGKKYSLDNIEHDFLRKEFEEPRIHFAIVCASISCPNLRREAYTAQQINQQLQEEAIAFINDPSKNKIGKNEVQLSKVFSWFKGDFTKNGSLINFINQYSKIKIEEGAEIDYLDYNWALNE